MSYSPCENRRLLEIFSPPICIDRRLNSPSTPTYCGSVCSWRRKDNETYIAECSRPTGDLCSAIILTRFRIDIWQSCLKLSNFAQPWSTIGRAHWLFRDLTLVKGLGEKFCLIAGMGKRVQFLVCRSSRLGRGGGRWNFIFDEKKILWDRQLVKKRISLMLLESAYYNEKHTLAFSRGWEDMSTTRTGSLLITGRSSVQSSRSCWGERS